MYNLYSKETSGYYLKVRNAQVQLISCLPDSNRNSAREFVWVSGNWHANELTCPTSPWDIGWYQSYHIYFYHTFFFFFAYLWSLRYLFIYSWFLFTMMQTVKNLNQTLTQYTCGTWTSCSGRQSSYTTTTSYGLPTLSLAALWFIQVTKILDKLWQ